MPSFRWPGHKHISAKFESDSASADEECPYLREGTAACEEMMYCPTEHQLLETRGSSEHTILFGNEREMLPRHD